MATPNPQPSESCERFRSEIDAFLDGSVGSLEPELAAHKSRCAECSAAFARRLSLRRALASIARVGVPEALDRAVVVAGEPAELVRLELRHLEPRLAPAELDARVRPGIAHPPRFVLIARRRVQWRVAAAAAVVAAVGVTAFRGAAGIGGSRDSLDGARFVLEYRPVSEMSPYWKAAVEVLAEGAPRDL
ncbi:MAG TPA: hypothetical protein VKE69_13405 [Planctomycetota bacterium]|nr:hypothetical protein [Planctomycetota bacterium]